MMGYFHLLQPLPSRKPHITFRDCIQLGSLSSASQNFDIESDSSGFSLKPEEHEKLSSSLFLRQHGVRIPWVALVFRIRENTLISIGEGFLCPCSVSALISGPLCQDIIPPEISIQETCLPPREHSV